MLNEKIKCRVSTGVGYCPIPALGHHTAVVSGQEGLGMHDRRAFVHDREPARARLGLHGKACCIRSTMGAPS